MSSFVLVRSGAEVRSLCYHRIVRAGTSQLPLGHAPSIPQALALRSRVMLAAATGRSNKNEAARRWLGRIRREGGGRKKAVDL